MKLPPLKLHHAPDWQKQRLERWLAEWELADDMNVSEPVEPETSEANETATPVPVAATAEEPAPAIGQIRLLSPELPAARHRLLYVAVLEAAGDEFTVAPYGRFAEPCLPGELLSGREVPCLRVLCLWNAVALPAALLQTSWVVDCLSDVELNEALAVHRASGGETDETLPEHLEQRVGPPQWHPADPRVAYMAIEREAMHALLNNARATGGPITYPFPETEHRLAADPHADYEAGCQT